MGTTINRPKRNPKTSDSVHLNRRKQQSHDNNNNNKKKNINSRQDEAMVARLRAKNLVMGEVKILKRGEDLRKIKKDDDNDEELYLSSTDRLGPEPEILLHQIQQIRVSDSDSDVMVENIERKEYAGSSAFQSPPPSSLPCPGFAGERANIRFGLRLLLGLGNSVL